MKKSKKAKKPKHEADGVDMISNLPDDVLRSILSRLQGTEEAIRTSILSRRWRYLWTALPSVDIDYARGRKFSKIFKRKKFKGFVSRVLANNSLDLDSFRLRCGSYYNMSTIGTWIDAAVMRKVKVVDLTFSPLNWSEGIDLPQCLVTCGSLESLRLCLTGFSLSLPKLTGFPALRVLELHNVSLDGDDDDDIVKYFLDSCSLLEDLSLIDFSSDSLVISCPNLKSLRIHTNVNFCDSIEICRPKLEFLMLRGQVGDRIHFQSLYSLKKAVIQPKSLYAVELPFDFYDRISHVEYLSINAYYIPEFFDPGANTFISLPNLKTLEIVVDWINMNALIWFLKCVPDLESLHLIFPEDVYRLGKFDLEEAETINILTRHLKKVEFINFNGEKSKLDIARALLEHGNELEEMIFSWDDEARSHERSVEIMSQVSNIHKASSTVKILVVFNPAQVS